VRSGSRADDPVDMAEQVTTAFIVLGGIVGIALGLYGLAPTLFQGRLQRLRAAMQTAWADRFDEDDSGEERFDAAYGLLVDSRRREHSLFGLPNAWRDTAPSSPEPPAAIATDLPEVAQQLRPLSTFASEDQVAALPRVEALALAGDLDDEEAEQEVLDMFRESLPAPASASSRTRAALGPEAVPEVRISDLLVDARWTAFALMTSREGSRT